MQKKMVLLIAIFGILFFQTARAQTYKYKLANSPDNTVKFTLFGSDISFYGYSGNQLIIKTFSDPLKSTKGVHAFSVYRENHTLKLVQKEGQSGNFTIKVPNKIHIILQLRSTNIKISNFKGEIEVKARSGNIHLKNITGPVVAHILSGNINVVFSHLSNAAPSSISVISGNIYVTLPSSTKADLNLSAISGKIYTDFDINMPSSNNNLTQNEGRNINDTLNDGGVELNLKVISGNIYLRKKK